LPTEPGPLVEVVAEAARAVTGRKPELSTTGGTSDARFIRALCPVVELGLVGATMHAVDERTPVAEIGQLTDVYRRLIRRYFETFSEGRRPGFSGAGLFGVGDRVCERPPSVS